MRTAGHGPDRKPRQRWGTIAAAIPSSGASIHDHPVRSRGDLLVKCKAKTASRDIEAVTMKNGRAATRSTCVDCGTRKFRIGVLP